MRSLRLRLPLLAMVVLAASLAVSAVVPFQLLQFVRLADLDDALDREERRFQQSVSNIARQRADAASVDITVDLVREAIQEYIALNPPTSATSSRSASIPSPMPRRAVPTCSISCAPTGSCPKGAAAARASTPRWGRYAHSAHRYGSSARRSGDSIDAQLLARDREGHRAGVAGGRGPLSVARRGRLHDARVECAVLVAFCREIQPYRVGTHEAQLDLTALQVLSVGVAASSRR